MEHEPTSRRPVDISADETWCPCGAIWRRATRICHCAACHRTFTGVAGFDEHRVTICTRCDTDNPCEKGRHYGPTRYVCAAGTTIRAEIVSDGSGRYKAPGNLEALTAWMERAETGPLS